MHTVVLANGESGAGVLTAVDAVLAGKPALDAVEAGLRVVELDPSVRTVGFGGRPNLLGELECDASIMCGASLQSGAVAALKNYFHAASVARQIMDRTPHVMLAGEGASLFASEIGEIKGKMLSEESRCDYENWLRKHLPSELAAAWPEVPLSRMLWASTKPATARGTSCFLVRTGDGNFAGGVSSSGWAYKHPGRLGDSAIIGAGLYVDNRFGAAACTHTGEMTIRAGTARAVVLYMKKGATVVEACHEARDDLRSLKGGYLGPVVIHGMDRDGAPYVLTTGNDGDVVYWIWNNEINSIESRKPVLG